MKLLYLLKLFSFKIKYKSISIEPENIPEYKNSVTNSESKIESVMMSKRKRKNQSGKSRCSY